MTDRLVRPARPSRARCVIKPEDWLDIDRRLFQQLFAPGDVLDAGGAGSHWAPATRAGVANAYGRWFKFWLNYGTADLALHPVERVTPEALAAYVRHLRQSSASTSIVAYVAFLQMALVAMAPERDWTWLRAFIARLKRASAPARDKQSSLQDPADLLAFGEELMALAEAELVAASDVTSWEIATRYRDGLMIAVLALCPLRRKNFCTIQIGRQLIALGDGGYTLAFAPVETKNHRPLAARAPDVLLPYLERYLTHYRPFLCGLTGHRNPDFPHRPAGSFLWVSKTGSALSQEAFYKSLHKLTVARFGRSVNPHLFRDCAATAIAVDIPEQVGIVLGLLGHAGIATSERYYIHAHSTEAHRRHQENVLALRRAAEEAMNGDSDEPPTAVPQPHRPSERGHQTER
jgi:site-specific recombinase XerD